MYFVGLVTILYEKTACNVNFIQKADKLNGTVTKGVGALFM